MKTFLFDTIERFKRYSQSLDVKTILCSKAWYVLNEDGDTENLIFQEDGTVLVSVNGSIKKYTWQYIPQNQSLNIMHTDTDGTMLKPAFLDGKVLAFQKVGTKECMFLIDDAQDVQDKLLSLDSVKQYLQTYEQNAIETEKKAAEAEEQRRLLEAQNRAEKERLRKEEIEKLKERIIEVEKSISESEEDLEDYYSPEEREVLRKYYKSGPVLNSKTAKIIICLLGIFYVISVVLTIVYMKMFDNWFAALLYVILSPVVGFYGWAFSCVILQTFDYYWVCREDLKKRICYSHSDLRHYTYRYFKQHTGYFRGKYNYIIEQQRYLCDLRSNLQKLEENN